MNTKVFLNSLTNKIFKIIPLKQEKNPYLNDYIDSLLREINGASLNIVSLNNNQYFISVMNTLKYLSVNECDFSICRKEVFKSLNNLDKVKLYFNGD